MTDPGFRFTAPMTVDLITIAALKALTAPELEWRPQAKVPRDEPGPFVYVLVNDSVVAYPGKTDSLSRDGAQRSAAYHRWVANYTAEVADGGLPDPMIDPVDGNLELVGWSNIVRIVSRYNLTPLVASVALTGETGAVWEARVKGLAAVASAFESLSGGSVWERKQDSLRAAGYDWAVARFEAFRQSL